MAKDEALHFFTPRVNPDPRPLQWGENVNRYSMQITVKDLKKLKGRGLGYHGTITDRWTGQRWKVYGAPCSLPSCVCDAVVKPVEGGKQC